MPTIEISKSDLEKLYGKKIPLEDLDLIAKAEPDLSSGNLEKIKLNLRDINRPDLWCVEGIVRELKSKKGKIPVYKVEKSGYVLKVDKKVKKIRPLIVASVIKNIKFNSEIIKQIIQLQENLCENFGRKRKEVALGIYNLDKINWPINYTTFHKDKLKFIPLDFNEPLTLRQILKKHEKGIKYSNLISSEECPILIDNSKNVLSMPPIINSEYTGRITEKTKNVFVEVTGYNFHFIEPVLNIITTALADRGGKIFSVKIMDKRKFLTPNLNPKELEIDIEEIKNITDLKEKEILHLIKKSGFEFFTRHKKNYVRYPAYRIDIMDSSDIAEDILIAYGYDKIKAVEPEIFTIGKISKESELKNKIAELLIGLEAQEILSFITTSKDKQLRMMKQKNKEVIEIEKPISENHSCIRFWLLPSLLEFLSKNKNVEYPQKIFEIGKVIELKNKSPEEKLKLCFVTSHKDANFTEVKQILNYILENLKIKNYKIRETENPSFITGRQAKIIINGKEIAILGEIHPGVLEKWNLIMPVSAFELDLTDFLI